MRSGSRRSRTRTAAGFSRWSPISPAACRTAKHQSRPWPTSGTPSARGSHPRAIADTKSLNRRGAPPDRLHECKRRTAFDGRRMGISRRRIPSIRDTLLAGIALLVSTVSPRAEPPPRPSSRQTWDALAELWTSGVNLAKPPGFPEIGKWMLAPDGGAAHWLGEVYEGKRLQEPINVILVVEGDGAGDATRRVLDASAAAGYPVRFGHSAGYRGS